MSSLWLRCVCEGRHSYAVKIIDRWLSNTKMATVHTVPLFGQSRPTQRAELLTLRALVLATAHGKRPDHLAAMESVSCHGLQLQALWRIDIAAVG